MFRRPLLPVGIWTVLIVLLMLLPGNYYPRVTSFFDWLGPDKLIHFFLFGIYAFLLLEGFRKQSAMPIVRKYPVIFSLLLGMVFAIFTEMMQKFVIPGRNGNMYDFYADAIGCLMGMISWYIIRRNGKKNLHSSKNYN